MSRIDHRNIKRTTFLLNTVC